jgi:hypothetical protein
MRSGGLRYPGQLEVSAWMTLPEGLASGHLGSSTPSKTWMTPFDCITSPMVTL